MELPPAAIGLLPIIVVVLVFFLIRFYRKWHDARIRKGPFTDNMNAILGAALPFLDNLPQRERERLKEKIKMFLAHKRFYGCAGLTITEEMQVTIAAEACLLILNHEGEVYPGLTSILVYPSAFIVHREQMREDGTVASNSRDLLGESWDNGRVVLAWDAVEHGVADFTDGNNVVIHEFAHQLDSLSGRADGVPPLKSNSYKSWARVLSQNFENLNKRARRGHPTTLDTYGATNPAEFFAVASETFFERPEELYKRRPDLFDELRTYYNLDPRDWKHAAKD